MVRRSLRSTPLVPPKAFGASLTAKFFRGLGDPTRVRILELLVGGERTVGELVEETGTLQGRLSSHLACLRWCGLVESRREGRQVIYRVSDGRIRGLIRLAGGFLREHAGSVELCQVIDPRLPADG